MDLSQVLQGYRLKVDSLDWRTWSYWQSGEMIGLHLLVRTSPAFQRQLIPVGWRSSMVRLSCTTCNVECCLLPCLCSQPIPKAAGRVRLFIQLSEPTLGEWVGFLMLSSTCSSPKSKSCIPLSSRGRRPPELVWWAVLCYSRRVTRAFQCPQSPSVWNGAGGNPLCCTCPAYFFASRLRRPGFGASAFTGTLVAGQTSGLKSAVDTLGFPIA